MRLGKRVAWVVLLAGAVIWSGVARPQAAPMPAGSFGDDLKKRLSSTDPTVQQAAEKELAGIAGMLSDPEMLQKLADAAPDAQSAAMLRQRIAQLRNASGVPVTAAPNGDLPPISLSVKNGMLNEVVAQLNATLKVDNLVQASGAAGPFTLEVRDKPFWEAMTALQDRQLFVVNTGAARISLSGVPQNPRPYAIDGPMITYITAISYRRTIDLQAMPEPAVRGDFTITLLQALDPRLPASVFGAPLISNAVDEQGQKYGTPGGSTTTVKGLVRLQSVSLTPPARPGKTISFALDSSIGASPAVARAAPPSPTAPVSAVIDDVQKHIGDAVAVPGGTVRVAQFEPAGAQIRMQVSFQSDGTTTLPRVLCTLLDGAGTRMWSGTVVSSMTTTIASRNATGPFKLEIRTGATPTEGMAARKFHFEFKDIALP